MVVLAETVGHAVDEPDIPKILSDGQFGELHRPERPPFSHLQKFVMDENSVVIVVPKLARAPFGGVVAVASHAGLEEGHEASVPVVDNAGDVDVPFDELGVVSDEVGAEDAAQRVRAQDHPLDLQRLYQPDDQQREVRCRAVVVPPPLVLPVETRNGEVHPPAALPHLRLQARPLPVVPRSSMQGEEGVLGGVSVVSDVAVPAAAEFESLFFGGRVVCLLLVRKCDVESLQISVDE